MRIAEIAVIAPQAEERKQFITAICSQLDVASEQLTVGRLAINDQLVLHLYGLATPAENQSQSWDLLSRKLLGYVVLFSWHDKVSFENIKPCLEQVTTRPETALVVAANVGDTEPPALQALSNKSIFVNQQGKFTFYKQDEAESAKKVLLTLIDLLLERAE
ncbi:hypothetical protein HUU05_10325 [candidate division KSB1 bacterium]|nr:hypothetical protein [candidate division KSB1 bacterium]